MSDEMIPIEAPVEVDLDAELERWAADDPELHVNGGGWMPKTSEDAEWAALRLLDARNQLRDQAELVASYERKVEDWKDRVLRPLARRVEYFDDRLRRFGLAQRALGRTKGHVSLPTATIKTVRRGGKAKDPKLVVELPEPLLAYVKTHQPDALVLSEKLLQWVVVDGKAVDHAGKPIPGVRVELQPAEPEVFTATVEVNE